MPTPATIKARPCAAPSGRTPSKLAPTLRRLGDIIVGLSIGTAAGLTTGTLLALTARLLS
jgi:hypothetical protein